jgi:lysophospholipase L1-like esterase
VPTNTRLSEPAPTPTALPSGAAVTIVALGDSLTEGDGDDQDQRGGYPGRLTGLANGVRPGTRVINLGRSGWDSGQLVAEQLPDAIAAHPLIALVWIGSNDLWYNNEPDQEEWDRGNYTANIDTILRTLTGAGARVYIALLDDQSKRPTASDPERGYTEADRAQMSRRVHTYNDIIAAKASKYGATTVDFYNTTIFTDPATLNEDGNHPNSHGYDIIARIWFEAIEPYLAP